MSLPACCSLEKSMENSRLRAQRSNESPGGAFKRQNDLAPARWRGLAPTSSAHDAQNADNARKNTAFPPVCKKCAKVCGHPENGKSHEESCDSSWDFGALEGTRIPGPLIKRAYFDGFLYPNLFQNARFDDIFAQLRPVSAPHAFSSCRIFVALFCRTITSTFFHQP